MGHVHSSTGSRLGEVKLLCSSVLPGPHLGRRWFICSNYSKKEPDLLRSICREQYHSEGFGNLPQARDR